MPQEVYEKIILSIEITDVNDNSPVFRSNEVRLEIPEALGVGEEFEVSELIAKDADIEDFATVSYSIVPPGTFDIAVKNGRTFLKVLKKLDRELAPRWSGSVIATDGGGREGSTQLVINIQDSNDNSPRFAQEVFSASVVENAPAGTFVYKVVADDLDNGLNGEIRYEIESVDPKSATGKFEIEQKSGIISTTGEIDRETMKTIGLTIFIYFL
ncbi:unnamed protein product [Oikopleura dioica]|uniref:Cadherin domain-containing protein n=1 Tax=Oikopleura dioica TaxID=34765 RepID=E4XNS9_OIKDI|nr:unnamed protein product [Oikopleura dioica]